MSKSDLARAVGRFEGDATTMVQQSVAAAERAFLELDACDAALDRASEEGERILLKMRSLLQAEAQQEIPHLFDEMTQIADSVRRSERIRQVLARILGQDEPSHEGDGPLPNLSADQLVPIPSAYDHADATDLFAAAEIVSNLLPHLKDVHQQRIEQVTTHLIAVLQGQVQRGFRDWQLAHAALTEARNAYALWQHCLMARNRDLGEHRTAPTEA